MGKRKLASFSQTIVIALVATQLATGSQLSYAGRPGFSTSGAQPSSTPLAIAPATPEEAQQVAPMLNLAAEIERAEEGELPREFVDIFHLANQRLEIVIGGGASRSLKTYSLNALDYDRPQPIPPDFDRDVKIEIDPETRHAAFVWHAPKGVTYRVPIETDTARPRIAAFARDKELLVLLSETGELFAMDMRYARSRLFIDPMVITRLTHAGFTPDLNGGIQAKFSSRGIPAVTTDASTMNMVAPLDREVNPRQLSNDRNNFGDFILFKEDASGRRALGVFDRSVIKTQLANAQRLAAYLASKLAPSADSEATLNRLESLAKDEALRAQAATQSARLAPLTQEALAALPGAAVKELIESARLNLKDRNRPRDSASTQEWTAYFEELRQEALRQAETDKKLDLEKRARLQAMLRQGEFGPEWRELAEALLKRDKNAQEEAIPKALLYRAMTSRGMKLLGLLAGGAALAKGADLSLFGGAGAVWATYLATKAYRDYLPDVLKDQVYRVTLLKSTLWLSAFVPFLGAVGHLYGRMSGRSWPTIRSLAALGMRINGTLALLFHHRLAWLTRQGNFIQALKAGVSPFARVQADSALGRSVGLEQDARAGLVNPLLGRERFEEARSRSSKALSALATRKQRARNLAMTFALLMASEQSGVDPSSLAALIESGGEKLAREQLDKIVENPAFKSRILDYQREIELNILGLTSGQLIPEFNQISPEDMTNFTQMAKSVAEKAQGLSWAKALAQHWWLKARFAPERVGRAAATFGTEDYAFLMAADPSNFTASAFWKQFVSDYLLTVGQIALDGPRADFKHPADLAAKEGNFLSTSAGHRYDMIDQVRIYFIDVTGRYALVYQKMKAALEQSYDPVEDLSLVGQEKKEGVVRGVWTWLKGAGNVHRANYGGIYAKTLVRQITTIQTAALMSILGRHFGGGQEWDVAAVAFAYSFLSADRAYRWLWAPINRGTQVYEETLEERKAILTQAKTELANGLRLGDHLATLNGTKKLIALYAEDAPAPVKELRAALEQAEQMITTSSPEELEAYRSAFRESTETTGALQLALATGNERAIGEAREMLLALYHKADAQDPIVRLNLTATELLQHALQNPPVATAPRKGLEWTVTLVGAYFTTKWGTEMITETFHDNIAWGPQIFNAAWKTALFFAGTYYGQKGFDALVHKWEKSEARVRLNNKIEELAEKWKEAKSRFGSRAAPKVPTQLRACYATLGGI